MSTRDWFCDCCKSAGSRIDSFGADGVIARDVGRGGCDTWV